MRLGFDSIPGTRQYRVNFSDVRVLEVNGNDLSSPAAQRAMPASVKAVAAAMPSLVVGGNGKVREVLGLKKILDAVIEAQPEDPPRVTHEGLRAALFAPQMQRVIRGKAFADWALWVAIWSGLDIQPGTRSEFTSVTESFGSKVPASGYFAHRGDAPGRLGLVRLRMQLVADGPGFRGVLFQTLAALAARAGQPQTSFTADRIEHAERREIVELVTDAKTLLPYEV